MDEQGNNKWSKHYKPFGEEIEQGEAPEDNRVSYTGHVHDRDTGLTYMGARHYDPVIGRFMGMDPAGVRASDPRTFNRFAYAANNPYKFIDPDGRNFLAWGSGNRRDGNTTRASAMMGALVGGLTTVPTTVIGVPATVISTEAVIAGLPLQT